MRNFADEYCTPTWLGIKRDATMKRIRVAILDTGLRFNDADGIIRSGSNRICKTSGNFLGEEFETGVYNDTDGHGTHVARILLSLTRHVEIVVVKISDGPTLEFTRLQQVVDVGSSAPLHWIYLTLRVLRLFNGPLTKQVETQTSSIFRSALTKLQIVPYVQSSIEFGKRGK